MTEEKFYISRNQSDQDFTWVLVNPDRIKS